MDDGAVGGFYYFCSMETTRQLKIARLVQKDLGMIFQQQSHILFGGAMITVTKVHITRDLAIAKTYLSLFATRSKPELMESIRLHSKEIRRELGSRVHKQLRIIPELQFYLDDSLDYIDNIEHLLKS
jgi:ribosome-binding factor A